MSYVDLRSPCVYDQRVPSVPRHWKSYRFRLKYLATWESHPLYAVLELLQQSLPKDPAMPSHEQMVAAVKAYVDAFAKEDTDAIARLYARDATVEDPIGTPIHRGIDAIRAFYAMSIEMRAKLTLEGPVRTVGNIAAFAFKVEVPLTGAPQRIEVIDTFTFDEQGKIIEMRAFWGPQNVHQI